VACDGATIVRLAAEATAFSQLCPIDSAVPKAALSPAHADVKCSEVDSFDPGGLEADRID